jgi:hypothetical protein
LARNRYGWQKRAKELARKEKSDEKMKRRQGKPISPLAEEIPAVVTEGTYGPDETASPEENSVGSFQQGQA